jgi:hypothetical protein
VAQQAQEVQVGGVRTNGGRHATHERYRGRHRKPRAPGRRRVGIRLAVTLACAALVVCLPQPSWADRTATTAAHPTVTSQATVQSLPIPVTQHG